MQDFIKQIRSNSYYQVKMYGDKPIFLYDDHRFVVPILWLAHQLHIIDAQINMVRFDSHFDALDFKREGISVYQNLKSFDEVFRFCQNYLGPIDDDWQTFAFDQKLVNKTLIFCDRKEGINPKHMDRFFSVSRIERAIDHQTIWDCKQVLLDIDCDYFTFMWKGAVFPWQDEFYRKEFASQDFMSALIEKSPFVTICFEPDFCGGRENADKIWNKINQMFFNV